MIDATRALSVLAFANEIVADDELLRAWADTFDGDDDATLILHAEGWSQEQVVDRLGPALGALAADPRRPPPDVLALPGHVALADEDELVRRCGAVLGAGGARPPFDTLRRVPATEVSTLRDLLAAPALTCPMNPRPVSPELQGFVDECPSERRTILAFMHEVADELEPGTRVLDVGAGEAPYRELFGHVGYRTSDWENSMHPGAARVDYLGSAEALPVPDASFDAVICTQVLEHVPEPAAVLAELHRILVPGGRLFLTLPLAWELHEEPFDFYRYTRYGIAHLLREAGFDAIDPRPRNDCFTTVAQLMRNTEWAMGRALDGRDPARGETARIMRQLADVVEGFAELDTRWVMPLGYAVRARRRG